MCKTSPCSNTQPRALSKCSARKLLQTALLAKIASFTASSEHLSFVAVMQGVLHFPLSTAAPRGQLRWIEEGLIHSGASLPSLNICSASLLDSFPHSCPKSSKFRVVPSRLQMKSISHWGDCNSVKPEVRTSPDL